VEGDVAGLGSPVACPLRRASDGAAFLPARRKRPLWTSSISPLRFRRETIFCSARRPWWRNSSAWAISRKLAGSRARARCAITSWSVNSSSLRIGRRHCTGFAASKRRQLFSRRRVERGRPTQTAPVHPQRTRRRPTPGTQRGGGTTWTASFLFFWELGNCAPASWRGNAERRCSLGIEQARRAPVRPRRDGRR